MKHTAPAREESIRLRFEQIDADSIDADDAARLIATATDAPDDGWWRRATGMRHGHAATGATRRELPELTLHPGRETRLTITDAHGRPQDIACSIGERDEHGLLPLRLYLPHRGHAGEPTCTHIVWLRPNGVTLLGLHPHIGSPVSAAWQTHHGVRRRALHFVRIRVVEPATRQRRTLWPWAAA